MSSSNSSSVGYFSSVYDSWGPSKTLAAVLFALTQTLGNVLLLGIVWYEKYGSDSYFRTLINQVRQTAMKCRSFN